jgi:hypothetical protein
MNDTLQFGLTLLVAGMGGTMLTLLVTAGIIAVLTKSFPPPHRHRGRRAED